MISDAYRSLCRELHDRNPDFGKSGDKFFEPLSELYARWGFQTVLDYGSGKGTLAGHLRKRLAVMVWEYEPAFGIDERCGVDLVVCADVLEHVEPEHLEGVLDELRALGRMGVYLAIGTAPATKKLADGRNAHLIVEPMGWWLPKLDKRWSRVSARELPRYEDSGKPSIDFEYIGAV